MSLIIAWLTSKLKILEWIVLGISWVGIAYAVHHYDDLTQDHSKLLVVQKQVQDITHVKIIHDKVNTFPVGGANAILLQRFHRPE